MLSGLAKDVIYVFDAALHGGEQGKYTINDQFAIGNPDNMTIHNDLFIYLPCYYNIMKLDWIGEILLGFHLDYNKIEVNKLPRHYRILRYPNRIIPANGTMTRALL
jgi:hypothetical protein